MNLPPNPTPLNSALPTPPRPAGVGAESATPTTGTPAISYRGEDFALLFSLCPKTMMSAIDWVIAAMVQWFLSMENLAQVEKLKQMRQLANLQIPKAIEVALLSYIRSYLLILPDDQVSKPIKRYLNAMWPGNIATAAAMGEIPFHTAIALDPKAPNDSKPGAREWHVLQICDGKESISKVPIHSGRLAELLYFTAMNSIGDAYEADAVFAPILSAATRYNFSAFLASQFLLGLRRRGAAPGGHDAQVQLKYWCAVDDGALLDFAAGNTHSTLRAEVFSFEEQQRRKQLRS